MDAHDLASIKVSEKLGISVKLSNFFKMFTHSIKFSFIRFVRSTTLLAIIPTQAKEILVERFFVT